MVQKALNEGRLQFVEKPKLPIKVNFDPMQTEDAHYVEPVEILMVEATKGFNMEVNKGEQISAIADSHMQTVYPQAEEGLIDFLERCKFNDSKTMLCPRCRAIFDEETTKKLEGTRRYNPRRGSQVVRFA